MIETIIEMREGGKSVSEISIEIGLTKQSVNAELQRFKYIRELYSMGLLEDDRIHQTEIGLIKKYAEIYKELHKS